MRVVVDARGRASGHSATTAIESRCPHPNCESYSCIEVTHSRDARFRIDDDVELLREQLAIRDQIIASQQAIIDELSAPFIPLANELAVVPFIGPFDEERIEQVTDRMLHAVAAASTRVLVVDLTGITEFDEHAAAGLARMGNALGLLGIRVVLTGIGPAIALMMAERGELSMLESHGSVQAAIAAHARPLTSSARRS
jgi:anti-anti-sigma regulatory factor